MSGMNNSKIRIMLGDINEKLGMNRFLSLQLADIAYMDQQTIIVWHSIYLPTGKGFRIITPIRIYIKAHGGH